MNFLSLNLIKNFQTLLESGEIIVKNKDILSCAIIDFKITLQYSYDPLEVAINMQFTYRVHVPGYTNRPEPNPCYSTDPTPPRKVFEFNNDYQHFEEDEPEQQIYNEHGLNISRPALLAAEENVNKAKENAEYFIGDDGTVLTEPSNGSSGIQTADNGSAGGSNIAW